MTTPARIAAALEAHPRVPRGPGERFRGYGVLALPFASGHVLALRRFPASSIGPGYTSVWHRKPDGRWIFYTDIEPWRSCPRYCGRGIEAARMDRISLRWTGPRAFTVSVEEAGLDWTVSLAASAWTRALNVAGRLVPALLWRRDGPVHSMAALAGRTLGTGPFTLAGRTPNGQRFRMSPRRVWLVQSSAAVLLRSDLGPAAALDPPPRLGGMVLPGRGLFAVGEGWFEEGVTTRAVPVGV